MMTKTLVLIPSRLSAKRLPGKPLYKINGLSIINHVYNKALKSNIGDVAVATGDMKILKEVKNFGGFCVLTNKKHKTGSDRIFEAYTKIKSYKYDYILNLQGDEPMINIKDIRRLNNTAKKLNSKMATLCCTLKKKSYISNKNIVKVYTNKKLNYKNSAIALDFFKNKKKKKKNLSMYHHIGIYIYKTNVLKKFVSLKQTKNEKKFKLEQLRALDNQIPINIILTKRKPIGVDTLHDYHKVKKLMENKKN